MVDARTYYETSAVVSRLDVDPSTDHNWRNWSATRPFTFVPELFGATHQIAPLDYPRLVSHANDLVDIVRDISGYDGIIRVERMTNEQIRFATGIAKSSGKLRPVRLDKALAILYAVNAELERKSLQIVNPQIYLSAFNIGNLSKWFAELERSAKKEVRCTLAKSLGQPEDFVGDFLKGAKASIDTAAGTFLFLKKNPSISKHFPSEFSAALETPTQKYTVSALGEDFSVGRVTDLPEPFIRPRSS